MFTVYYSNDLNALAEMLIQHQKVNPNPDPFSPETVLVQSVGMAQWLQMQIADKIGVAGHYQFPFPTSFIWQQYRLVFPYLPKENIFERSVMAWRLMRLIPTILDQEGFEALRSYLNDENKQTDLRLYQLANKIADLFDQYLVYRPEWLVSWENNQYQAVLSEIKNQFSSKKLNEDEILENIIWQSKLWNLLIADTRKDYDELLFTTSHRAYLQNQYFEKLDHLTDEEKLILPKRIFVFGISSMPPSQLAVLRKLSEHCEVHLFFLNPSEKYWGDSLEESALEKMALKQQLSQEDIDDLLEQQGNQLLAIWGKQGRDFLAQLVEAEPDSFEIFIPPHTNHNLAQLKQAILDYDNEKSFDFNQDRSIQIHRCHSVMREVEVLHNQLLNIFAENPTLSAKDVIVMSPNIEKYAPYIHAVFSRYEKKENRDKRYIPFTISDQKMTEIDPVLSSFIYLLSLKESHFSAEELLDLLDVRSICEKFGLTQEDIFTLREWIKSSGIRAELNIKQTLSWENYNSWENGLNRLLLGTSLKEENGIWQETVAFSESYGLLSEKVGYLVNFIEKLTAWSAFLQENHSVLEWKSALKMLIQDFYQEQEETTSSLLFINQEVELISELIEKAKYEEALSIEVISSLLKEKLNYQQSYLQFLAGKVNFCTLLPMRAIPFKVVCLLGMNETDFPRQQTLNSFDLMQYHPQKGDRARRDDDRYLFLEALLSAQDIFYISYIGQSLEKSEEYHPSVLVSQLIDYLERNSENGINNLIQTHPMSLFSSKNFEQDYISYDKEWLPLAEKKIEIINFIQSNAISETELPTSIKLDELISFIQAPARYFFRNRLGVNFNHNEDVIEENEHFSLSNLDEYKILNHLLSTKKEESYLFFEKENLKGNIPILNFGQLKENELEEKISEMRNSLVTYLNQESSVVEINVAVNNLEIVGNIPYQFGNEIILWKTGSLKDKNVIQLWIYYLVLLLSGNVEQSPRFYYLSGEELASLSFENVELEQAKEVLSYYVSAYLRGFVELDISVTENLGDYFKNIPEENIDEYCEKALLNIVESYHEENVYLKRILDQSDNLNYQHIHQNTLNWFSLMKEKKKEHKDK